MWLQTFREDTFEFRAHVDPIATFNFQPLPLQPVISIVPGPPERYVAVIPMLRRPGEIFSFGLKAEGKWSNPSDQCDILFYVEPDGEIDHLPEKGDFHRVMLRPRSMASRRTARESSRFAWSIPGAMSLPFPTGSLSPIRDLSSSEVTCMASRKWRSVPARRKSILPMSAIEYSRTPARAPGERLPDHRCLLEQAGLADGTL